MCTIFEVTAGCEIHARKIRHLLVGAIKSLAERAPTLLQLPEISARLTS